MNKRYFWQNKNEKDWITARWNTRNSLLTTTLLESTIISHDRIHNQMCIGKSWLLFFRSRINQKRFYLFELVYRKYVSPAIELIIWQVAKIALHTQNLRGCNSRQLISHLTISSKMATPQSSITIGDTFRMGQVLLFAP